MDYKEKYNKLVEAVKVLQETNQSDEGIQNWVNDNVPELRESEDEKTRKEIVGYLKKNLRLEWATWLEKQGNQREQLINKACVILVNCIEDYLLRRMEVWDEESKKQTLANIRKKLEE